MVENTFNILIIDDNPDQIELLKEFIEDIKTDLGVLKIKGFTDENEGIEYFKRNRKRINAVLVDYTLPQINGIEVLKILRKLDQNIPIIGLTGHSEDAFDEMGKTITEQFIKAGANGYISKSSENYTKIDKIINNILEKSCIKENTK